MIPLARACALSLLLPAMSCLAGATDTGFAGEFRAVRAQGQLSHALLIDNDSLLLNRDDGFYTSGFRYEQLMQAKLPNGSLAYGWHLGQALYTASDIKLPPSQVGPPDHPYAGWLYGGLSRKRANDDGSFLEVGVDVGCLGPCAGGETVQTNLHRLLRQPLPQAWSKQVRNEAGLVLHADFAPVSWRMGPDIELIPDFHGRFGNIFTDAGGGLTLRVGKLDKAAGRMSLHGFGRADVDIVAYNATLQGGYFSSANAHTVAPKRVVAEAEIGVAWAMDAYALRASVLRRTNEIRGLPDAIGAQNFVRLVFSYTP